MKKQPTNVWLMRLALFTATNRFKILLIVLFVVVTKISFFATTTFFPLQVVSVKGAINSKSATPVFYLKYLTTSGLCGSTSWESGGHIKNASWHVVEVAPKVIDGVFQSKLVLDGLVSGICGWKLSSVNLAIIDEGKSSVSSTLYSPPLWDGVLYDKSEANLGSSLISENQKRSTVEIGCSSLFLPTLKTEILNCTTSNIPFVSGFNKDLTININIKEKK